jgi:uncharacterized RDD family membrane protein YckC
MVKQEDKVEMHQESEDSNNITPATMWRRLLAGVIDGISFIITYLLFLLLITGGSGTIYGFFLRLRFKEMSPSALEKMLENFADKLVESSILYLFILILCVLLFSFIEVRRDGSMGKKWMGLRLIRVNGSNLSFSRLMKRNGAKLFGTLLVFLGYVPMLFNKRKQAVHDKLADTIVIDHQ